MKHGQADFSWNEAIQKMTEGKMNNSKGKDEVGERLEREIRLYQTPVKRGGFMEPLKGLGEYGFYPARLNLLKDLKAERDTLKSDNEALRHKPGINLCSCKSIEDCDANSDAEDEWCRVDYNSGIFE